MAPRLVAALLVGVVGSLQTSHASALVITNIPHVAQLPDFCGEACVEMVMRSHRHVLDQRAVFNLSGADPVLGRGCVTRELRTAMTAAGLDPGDTWYAVKAGGTNAISTVWRSLVEDLRADLPSIVCMRTGDQPSASEHFRLIVGYDTPADEVVYHEPAATNGAFHRMKLERFLSLWPLKYQDDVWTLVCLRCKVVGLKPYAPHPGFTNDAYAQHVRALRSRLPVNAFSLVVQPPFVVIGDEPAVVVKARATSTVGWAVSTLKKDFFTRDPDRILNVWLFKDKSSYETNCREILAENPTTPFGFCSSKTGDLIMNIATGGGTLVHEIVHPYMHANFPECPAWFNEGMGSLYEQSAERDGHITGLTNWRLEGLQKAIRSGRVPSFETLTGASPDEFYGDDRGTNYAQSRYLCYYLQQNGLLVKYYRAFLAAQKEDATGYRVLKDVTGEKDMATFKRNWEKFVMGLTFP